MGDINEYSTRISAANLLTYQVVFDRHLTTDTAGAVALKHKPARTDG